MNTILAKSIIDDRIDQWESAISNWNYYDDEINYYINEYWSLEKFLTNQKINILTSDFSSDQKNEFNKLAHQFFHNKVEEFENEPLEKIMPLPESYHYLIEKFRIIRDYFKAEEEDLHKNQAPSMKEDITSIKPQKSIQWMGTQGQLIYLFEQLREKNLLPLTMDIHSTLTNHFVDSNHRSLKNLKQTKQGYLNSKTAKPSKGGDIDEIVSKTKKI